MDTATLPKTRKPTGRPPQGYVRANIVMKPDMLEWAKMTEEGLSAMVRRLIREEYERQKSKAS